MMASIERDTNISMHVINFDMVQPSNYDRFGEERVPQTQDDWVTVKREEELLKK
jgi:hypothetical protein